MNEQLDLSRISSPKNSPLEQIADVIETICATPATKQSMVQKLSFDRDSVVQRGRLHIARLNVDSNLVIRTILSLYLHTVGYHPSANQILFCNPSTQWEELYLILQRCKQHSDIQNNSKLYCIAFVELLPLYVRSQLVEKLSKLRNSSNFLLAVIIRSTRDHPFLKHFKECLVHPEPLTENEMKTCYKNSCQDVTIVTSDRPGAGKTEKIHEIAFEGKKNVIKLHISGAFKKQSALQHLLTLDVKKHHLLHIDISTMIMQTPECNIFLFEPLFLGIVCAGTALYRLPTTHIAVEIANTLHNTLKDSLPDLQFFTHCHLEWKGLTEYKVPSEVTSKVQVVCQYLKCNEKNRLDEDDIYFTGKNRCETLGLEECRSLIAKHTVSYTLLNTFISVLAEQLKRLSKSTFFRTKHLQSGILDKNMTNNVKSTLVNALIGISREFASKSIHSIRTSQSYALDPNLGGMNTSLSDLTRISESGMVKWEDSNHLMIVFHNNKDKQSASAVYKDLDCVPSQIQQLFAVQGTPLKDIDEMLPEEKQKILIDIACSDTDVDMKTFQELSHVYALTTDNILKMVLILLRVQANIPVVIMGETGCGKTSAIRYLATLCKIKFEHFAIHAGTVEKEITEVVSRFNEEALNSLKKPIWLFFDEINTSDSIGLLCDILCHHKLNGKDLSPNLVILAACNPYKLKRSDSTFTSGLAGKLKSDSLSRLVYRVHPLPETILEYVWDFGNLSANDELKYISKMIKSGEKIKMDESYLDIFISLIHQSQSFIRTTEKCDYSVSLRDVKRCRLLFSWFVEEFPDLQNDHHSINEQQIIKSMILAMSACYFCRLQSHNIRQEYLDKIAEILSYKLERRYSGIELEQTIISEQTSLLNAMELPEGIAINAALRENVFMILVSAINKIPLFLVGKPGCSKSLSMQLIRNNARGKDSPSSFFAKLPRIMCIYYQGSESCTSEGISKVFEKAQRITTDENVLPLIVLDEIGLAEVSKFNPLKVLHSLLEPFDKIVPDIAVVGISNWALDAAKMNRAIHLSRPDMTYDDILETGLSITKSLMCPPKTETRPEIPLRQDIIDAIKAVSKAYVNYVKRQSSPNFHGLRDYYSMIKYLSKHWFCRESIDRDHISNIVQGGLCRNFGGRENDLTTIKTIFKDCLKYCQDIDTTTTFHIRDVIKENLLDSSSRHLMLISDGDAITSALHDVLTEIGKDYVTIFGSNFEDDQSDDFNYRILSQIILCMEQGKVLILKDLDNIYGSLYDMLNQNYTTVAQKKHCRIAHGEYSNPLCHVHDEFKCVVLLEEESVEEADPPFLNRFEKQFFKFEDQMNNDHRIWMEELSELFTELFHDPNTCKNSGTLKEGIPIIGPAMLSSLILQTSQEISESDANAFHELCVSKLLMISKPEAILQYKRFSLYKNNSEKATDLVSKYFQLPIHHGLLCYANDNDTVKKSLVLTFSNIHDSCNALENESTNMCRISHFKSKKEVEKCISEFFESHHWRNLVFQLDMRVDLPNLLLTKFLVDSYIRSNARRNNLVPKQVNLVIHLERNLQYDTLEKKLSYHSGWQLVYLDSLETPRIDLPVIRTESISEVLEKRKSDLPSVLSKMLCWAFARLNYAKRYQKTMEYTEDIIIALTSDKIFLTHFTDRILGWIKHQELEEWIQNVAADKTKLETHSSLTKTIVFFVESILQEYLAKILFQLENLGALSCVLDIRKDVSKMEIWITIFNNENFFGIKNIPAPEGPACYMIDQRFTETVLPFSSIFIRRVESLKSAYIAKVNYYKDTMGIRYIDDIEKEQIDHIFDDNKQYIFLEIADLIKLEYHGMQNDYIQDFCIYSSSEFQSSFSRQRQIHLFMFLIALYRKLPAELGELIAVLHTTIWLYGPNIMALMQIVETAVCSFGADFDTLLNFSNKGSDNIEVIEELLDHIFRIMIPRSDSKVYRDIITWQQKVNGMNFLAEHYGRYAKIQSSVKLCHDLAVLLFLPYSVKEDSLCTFGNCLSLPNTELESPKVFNCLLNVLKEYSKMSLTKPQSHVILQTCLCMYANRCFDIDPDKAVGIVTDVLAVVFRGDLFEPSLVSVGPILALALDWILDDEVRTLLPSCTKEEYDNNILVNTPFLACIDSHLESESFGKQLALLVVTCIQQRIYDDLITVTSTDENKMAILSENCIEICLNSLDNLFLEKLSMQKLSAISLLRTFLEKFLCALDRIESGNIAVPLQLYSLVNELLMRGQAIHAEGISLYFYRCAEAGNGLKILQTSVQRLSKYIECLKDVPWNKQKQQNCFEMNSLMISVVQNHAEIRHSLESIELDKNYITGHRDDVLMYICALCHNTFNCKWYNLKEIQSQTFITNMIQHVVQYLLGENKLISCLHYLTGKDRLNGNFFHVTSETSTREFQQISFIMKVVCTVQIYCRENNILKMLVDKPATLEGICLPWISDERNNTPDVKAINCACGHRFYSIDDQCPISQHSYSSQESRTKKRYLLRSRSLTKSSGPAISFISRLIMRLILNSCFMISYALDNNLSLFQKELKAKNSSDVVYQIQQRFNRCWNRLQAYFQMGDTEMCQILGIVLNQTKVILSAHCKDNNIEETTNLDQRFSEEINQIFTKPSESTLKDVSLYLKIFAIPDDCLEHKVSFISEMFHQHMYSDCDLYERVLVPTKDNLFLELSLHTTCKEHPFLCLLMEKDEQLQLLDFLSPLIDWHFLLVHDARFLLKTSDCKTMTTRNFVNHLQTKGLKTIAHRYEKMKKAWNTLCKDYQNQLCALNERITEIDLLTDTCIVEQCIIHGKSSLLYKLIEAISTVQNNFLDNVLRLTSTMDCYATSFLKSGNHSAAVRMVNVMQLDEKDVLKFVFSKALSFSQIKVTSPSSRKVEYDFQNIEQELAPQLFGKPYIDMSKEVLTIAFIDDLSKNSVQMMEDIKVKIKQIPINETVKADIKQEIQKSTLYVQQLLKCTGVLLSIVKQSDERTDTLIRDFIDKWKRVLPQDSNHEMLISSKYQLKLCHIVAVYKLFEAQNGENIKDSVSEIYRDNLENNDKEFIKSAAKEKFQMLQHTYTAMNVFLHRSPFLVQKVDMDRSFRQQQLLHELLSEKTYWCEDCGDGSENSSYIQRCLESCVPKNMKLKNFHSAIVYIEERIGASAKISPVSIVKIDRRKQFRDKNRRY